MKVTSSKPKGQRIFKSETAKSKRPYWIEPVGSNWWFSLSEGQWIQGYNGTGGKTTSYYSMECDGFNDAWTLKAVKRLIAKWDVPKGTWFTASLPFVGYEFKIRK